MKENRFWLSIVVVSLLVAVLWVVFFLMQYNILNLDDYANWPRHREGLKGILVSPFIHGNLEHIISNTLPLMVLLAVLLNAYPRVAYLVLIFVHLLSGSLVWLFAPEWSHHIGASGVVYGIAFFLIASGFFRRDRISVSIAIMVTLAYGGMVAGFVPQPGMSWQSHLFGALSGVFIAFAVRRVDLPPPHPFELEKVEEDRHFFDENP